MELKVIGSSSAGNGYVLEARDEALLIEAGVHLADVKKAVDWQVSKIKGCIVSHCHNDHAGHAREYADAAITVLALPQVLEAKGITRHGKAIEPGKGYIIGDFRILPFEVHHDVPCVGYKIDHPESGSVLFLTDTYAYQYDFKGISHWMIEANYADDILTDNILEGRLPASLRKRLMTSHMSIDNAIAILRRSDLTKTRNIVLIHLSDGNSNLARFEADTRAATGKRVRAALPGMVIPFDRQPIL